MRLHSRRCVYCGNLVSPATATWEHIIPLSKGGTNYQSNKKTCCNKCNNMRGSLSWDTFREKIRRLMESVEHKFKLQTILVNIDYLEAYADKMGNKLYKKVKNVKK